MSLYIADNYDGPIPSRLCCVKRTSKSVYVHSNREMPEEHNRVLTDHCATVAFCPTQTAVHNLARESITRGVYLVGDTMYDAVLQFATIARQRSTILQDLGLEQKGYLLATVHRPYNTDVVEHLRSILTAFLDSIGKFIFYH